MRNQITNKSKDSICAVCSNDSNFEIVYPKNFNLDNDLTAKIFSARRIPDKCHGTIVRCKVCGLVRTLEVIDNRQLNNLYSSSTFTYGSITEYLKKTYSPCLIEAERYIHSKKSYLEIGCGNGFMLEEAKALGYKKIVGVEPSVDAISHARKAVRHNIKNTILKSNTFRVSQFDIISAFQVFDHISDPNNFLRICHRILKPKGALILMNHDVGSFSAKVLAERSPIFDIEHSYLYDFSTIRKILIKNNFIVREIYSPGAIMTLRYIIRLLPFPNNLKKRILKLKWPFLDKTIKIYPGNLCAIATKK